MLAVNYVDVEQQSPEWFEMRKGMVTGSMVRNAIARMKKQPKDGVAYMQCREDYMVDIVTTRITGEMSARYVSKAMEEGIEREPDALQAYEAKTGEMVIPGGFIYHPEIQWYGTSPDGLVGDDIVIEAKCPTQATHARYIREYLQAIKKGIQYVPEEYVPQVKSHLGCSNRSLCHFISFNPGFPKGSRLLISPWSRDKGAIAAQEAEVALFLNEAEQMERELRSVEL